jgi:hypothetical protein
MTITSQIINSGSTYEFTYTFDEVMVWSTFNWQSFLFFGSTNPSINYYNDFDIVYNELPGDKSFKLLLTPKIGVSLASENLCTVIRPEAGNPVNVSALLNKLSPKVYNSYKC